MGWQYVPWEEMMEINLSLYLLIVFLPLLLVGVISNASKEFAKGNNNPFVTLGWQISVLVLWVISTAGLSLALMVHFNFTLFFISLGVIITGVCSISTCNKFIEIKPSQEPALTKLKTQISYAMICLIIVAVFSACLEYLGFSISLAFVFAVITALVLFNFIPLLRNSLSIKNRFIVNAFLLICLSIMIDISILSHLSVFQPITLSVFSASFLIPVVILQLTIYMLSKHVITKDLANKLHQLVALVMMVTIVSIVYTPILNNFTHLVALLISSFIITSLLVADMVTFKWITTDRLIVFAFLLAFSFNSVSLGLIFAANLAENMDLKIVAFILFLLPLVFGLLKFVVWGNAKILQTIQLRSSTNTSATTSSQSSSQKEIPLPNQYDSQNAPGMNQVQTFSSTTLPSQFHGNPPLTYNLHNRIINQFENIVPIFDAICLFISLYLGIRMIISDALSIPVAIVIIGTSLLSAFTTIENKTKMTAFFVEYCQALLSIALYYLFTIDLESTALQNLFPTMTANFFKWGVFSLQLLIIGVSAFISTHHTPINRYVKNFQSTFLVALIFYPFYIAGIEITFAFAFVSLIFTVSVDYRFKNLLFRSLLPWSLAVLVGHFIWNYATVGLLLNILIPFAVGSVLQWIVLQYYYSGIPKLKKSKSIVGYTAIFSSLATYVVLYLTFEVVLGLLTPVVFSLLIIAIFQLKKIPTLSHRIKIYNQIIILATFVIFYFAGANYFFFQMEYQHLLAISLATAFSGFVNLKLFDKLNVHASKFLIGNLLLSTVSSGIFLGLFLNDPTLFALDLKFAIPVALDFAVLMFFLAIRAYQGSFKNVWDYGWYIWNVMPIVNWFLISPLVSGLDQISVGIPISSSLEIYGSSILALILVSFLELPVFISKLKKNFNKIIYGFWLELWIFSIWGAQNLFLHIPFAKIAFIFLAGFLLLVPIFTYYKQWSPLTILWPFLAVTNILFFTFLLEFPRNWMIPVDFLIAGIYILVLAYFPNIKTNHLKARLSLVLIGYFTIYTSVFTLLFNFIATLGVPSNIALNITFIIMSFGLLSGKWVDLSEKGLKFILSIVSIVNVGLLTAQSMALIPGFALFGIFLGIAFALGSIFVFQSRNFLPPIFKEIIWFGMALFMGLSITELLLTLTSIGNWASLGILILVTCLICLPLSYFRKNLFLIDSFIVLSISLILMQGLYSISLFVQWYQPLVFIDLFLGLELAYMWATSNKPRYALAKEEKINLEVFVAIWMVFSTLIAYTMVRFVLDFIAYDFDLLTILVGTSLGFSLLALLGMKPIRDYNLFSQFALIEKIMRYTQTTLIILSYLSTALLIGNIIPSIPSSISLSYPSLFDICYRLSVVTTILLIEIALLDQYRIKLISPELRDQLIWALFFVLSLSGFTMIQIGVANWSLSLFLFCIVSFATIRLFTKANDQINPELLNLGNALILIGNLFIVLWDVLNIGRDISNLEFHTLSLNLIIASGLIFGFVKIKIIPQKIQTVAQYAITFFIALSLEEVCRVFLGLSPLFNLSVFLLVFSLLNIRKITHSFTVYLFWLTLAFSIAGFIIEPISSLTGNFFSKGDLVVLFLFNLTTLFSIFTYRMANPYIHQSSHPIDTFTLDKYSLDVKPIHHGYSKIKTNQKIFVGSALWSSIVTTIGGTMLWSGILANASYISSSFSTLQHNFLRFSLSPIIMAIFAASLLHYIKNEELWFEHEKVKNQLLLAQKLSGVLLYILIPIFFTSNLHFLFMEGIENIWMTLTLDCFIFTGLVFLCVSLVDRKVVHFVEDQLSLKISVGALLGIGVSLFGFWYILTNNLWGGLIIFSLFSFSLKPYARIYDKFYPKLIFILNLSLYFWILVQLGDLLYSLLDSWAIATMILLVCIHLAIEIESHFTFLRPVTQWIQTLRKVSWALTSLGTTGLLILLQIPSLSVGLLFLDLLLLTLEGFYLNYIIYHHQDAEKYARLNQRLGLISYGEIIGLATSFLIPVIFSITTDSAVLNMLGTFGLSSIIIFVMYGLIYLDEKGLHLIQNQYCQPLRLITYLLLIGSFAADCGLLVMYIFDLTPVIYPPQIQILTSLVVGTGIVALAFLYRFRNKIVNQVFYWILSLEIVVLCYDTDTTPVLAITILILSSVLYFFVFFMEIILKALRFIITKIVQFFKNIWFYVQKFFKALVRLIISFYQKFKKAIYFSAALILSVVLFYLLETRANFNIVSQISATILVFLIVVIPISPEVQKETTGKTFAAKIVYRLMGLFSIIGISYQIAPPYTWWIPFLVFFVLAALIWGVLISEKEYGLSVYPRLIAVILTTLDVVLTVILFVIENFLA